MGWLSMEPKVLRTLFVGFFFICALYVAIGSKSLDPLIGFAIFIVLAYMLFLSRKSIRIDEGKISMYPMVIMGLVGLIYYVGSTIYYSQGSLDEETTRGMVLVSSFTVSLVVISFLTFTLGLHDMAYMHTREGTVKSFLLIMFLLVLTVLIFKGLVIFMGV